MNHFTLAQTEEDRFVQRERLKKHYQEKGFSAGKLNSAIDRMMDPRHQFGLENEFKHLTKKEEQVLAELCAYEERLSIAYEESLLDMETRYRTMEILDKTRKSICKIQGHRLSEELECATDTSKSIVHYRTCVVCKAPVFKQNITKDDTVVKHVKAKVLN